MPDEAPAAPRWTAAALMSRRVKAMTLEQRPQWFGRLAHEAAELLEMIAGQQREHRREPTSQADPTRPEASRADRS